MYRCEDCKAMFVEPESIEICYEDYYGVSSMFADRHYGSQSVCPVCGSEQIEEIWCDEDCMDCSWWTTCNLDVRKEKLDEE